MYASVYISEKIELPYFPDSISRSSNREWQSKEGLDPHSGPYKLTSDKELHRKEYKRQEKSSQEKQDEAEKWGFESWEEYISAYESMRDRSGTQLYPEEINYDSKTDTDSPPVFFPTKTSTSDVWWANHNMHGTFEFHTILACNSKTQDVKYHFQYEAQFTQGSLDDIIFCGFRNSPMSREESIEQLSILLSDE